MVFSFQDSKWRNVHLVYLETTSDKVTDIVTKLATNTNQIVVSYT